MKEIDSETLANINRTARFFLEKRPAQNVPVSAAQIDAFANQALNAFLPGAPNDVLELYRSEVKRHLAEGERILIGETNLLVQAGHTDWYFGDRLKTRVLFDRYKRYLAFEKSIDGKTVASVDRASDRIVSQLGDPASPHPFDRRGLVVGQVQSGKTTSYSAVINKAIDAGYRVIVVLTGTHESLRVQTQKRIEEGVRGLATESGKPGGLPKDAVLPLAKLQNVPLPPHMMTTRAFRGDFNEDARHYATVVEGTQIYVVKKNRPILEHLRRFFSTATFSRNASKEIVGRPLLVIDDEADNASVDTKRPDHQDRDHDPSAINREIRALLMQFSQRSYVGYTATPYANILIHKDNITDDLGHDLFPKDFVVMLPAPSNYVGPGTFFGASPAQEDGATEPPMVRYIEDCGITREKSDWMPLAHEKTHVPRHRGELQLPTSLQDAIICFLLAVAIRDLRGRAREHNSMLVHVSRFKRVQTQVLSQIEDFIYSLKGELDGVSNELGLKQRVAAVYQAEFVGRADEFASEDRGIYPPWDHVCTRFRDRLDLVDRRVVNSEAQADLEYDDHRDGLTVICVGGDKLSRGLTLEGLSVSYFLRATRMYDTLMQMGRWFGYRPGYKDLCRLFLTRELGRWYSHVTRADEELRAEFQQLEDENATPLQFSLRVQSHPHLMVTAPAKMAAADTFNLDFGGRNSQTIHFCRDRTRREENWTITQELLKAISDKRMPEGSLARRNPDDAKVDGKQPLPGVLYSRISPEPVLSFLRKYNFHEEARRVTGPQLTEFLQIAMNAGALTEWSVVVASGAKTGKPVPLTDGVEVVPVERAIKPRDDSQWDPTTDEPITIGVLASPTDLLGDLNEREVARYAALPSRKKGQVDEAQAETRLRNRACRARDEARGLLVLYVVQPTKPGADKKKNEPINLEPTDLKEQILPVGFALALPTITKVPAVQYVVNSVFIDNIEEFFEKADAEADA